MPPESEREQQWRRRRRQVAWTWVLQHHRDVLFVSSSSRPRDHLDEVHCLRAQPKR